MSFWKRRLWVMAMLAAKDVCTGCNACGNICEKKCITLKQDDEGFYYPKMDMASCIHCGKCSLVCPMLHTSSNCTKVVQSLWGYIKDDTLLYRSSSGGIVSSLNEKFKAEGAVVFGVRYAKDFSSVVYRSSEEEDIKAFRKSKYIECPPKDLYKKVGHYLTLDKTVLICGTPCHMQGLRAYLRACGIQQNTLYVISFVCHGVPSQNVWKSYISEMEKRYQAHVISVDFRSKKYGWDYSNVLHIVFDNGKIYEGDLFDDPYYRLFVKDIDLRLSCYYCNCLKHCEADLIVSDHLQASLQQKNHYRKGLSLLSICSEKGITLASALKEDAVLQKYDQHVYFTITDKSKAFIKREKFFAAYKTQNIFAKHGLYDSTRKQKLRSRIMKSRKLRYLIEQIYHMRK